MKILTTPLFLLLCLNVYAQESKEPFRKANTVIIKIANNEDTAYQRIASIIMQNGYAIEYSDEVLHALTTKPKAFNKGQVQINAIVSDDEIRLTANYFTALYPDLNITVLYKGDKNDANGIAWKEMMKIAKAYDGEEILYASY